MNPDSSIYVAGNHGMVGSAIVRRLKAEGFHNLLLRSHGELDLTNQAAVGDFFSATRPGYNRKGETARAGGGGADGEGSFGRLAR